MSTVTENVLPKTAAALEKEMQEAQQWAEAAAKSAADKAAEYAEVLAIEEERKRRAAERREAARERLHRQILDLSPNQLVEALLDNGVTCLGAGLITAYDLVKESAEIFERTFWTTGTEIKSYGLWSSLEELEANAPEKHLAVQAHDGQYMAVTSLCSVGAIGLVRAMKAQGSDPASVAARSTYGDLFQYDWPTRIAAEATAMAMREKAEFANGTFEKSATDSIISLNDSYMSREDVIEAFKAALDNPLLDAKELWGITSMEEGDPLPHPRFGSKEEAENWIRHFSEGVDLGITGQKVRWWYGSTTKLHAVQVASEQQYEKAAAEHVARAQAIGSTVGSLYPTSYDDGTMGDDEDDE